VYVVPPTVVLRCTSPTNPELVYDVTVAVFPSGSVKLLKRPRSLAGNDVLKSLKRKTSPWVSVRSNSLDPVLCVSVSWRK
jgi:hypothetical protein